jgi:hypothetical protein
MGTTLTGTTPQDTYDSLIKVTDNGPLSATAKYLSDGLGNDSILSLSTATAGVGITNTNSVKLGITGNSGLPASSGTTQTGLLRLKASNNATLDIGADHVNAVGWLQVTDVADLSQEYNLILQPNGGNVGIGTSTPESKLHVAGTASGSDVTLYIDNAASSTLNNSSRLKFSSDAGSSVSNGGAELNCLNVSAGDGAVDLLVKSWTGGAYTEKARFLAGGGLTFNGDTAAANALDDYEEGTWTMGVSFGGASVGVTYTLNTGTYTKIGRQVTVNGYLVLSNKGSSTGNARITGLPFTVGGAASNYSAATLYFAEVVFANQFQGYSDVNTTTVILEETTILGTTTALTNADFANNSNIMVSATYFV